METCAACGNSGSVPGFLFNHTCVDVPFNVENIMRYEGGEMPVDEIAPFFQAGIDNGMVWNLQGSYGRTARDLIANGYCHE
jgi:hypothetical protein